MTVSNFKVSRECFFAAAVTTRMLAEAGSVNAGDLAGDLGVIQTQDQITVTVDNFVRAETAMQIDRYQDLAGGVNTVGHFRTPTPIDRQSTIRMNRDTLYDWAVVDISVISPTQVVQFEC